MAPPWALTGPSQSPDELAATTICISELMPVNDFSLMLDDGATPDWVELHNPSEYPVCVDEGQLHNEGTGTSAAHDGIAIEEGFRDAPADARLSWRATASARMPSGCSGPTTTRRPGRSGGASTGTSPRASRARRARRSS